MNVYQNVAKILQAAVLYQCSEVVVGVFFLGGQGRLLRRVSLKAIAVNRRLKKFSCKREKICKV